MKGRDLLQISLGVLTAIGGFLDVGATATAGEAGAKFGLGLVWAVVLGTIAIILLLMMVGKFTAVTKKPYAAAIREHFGFKFYLVPLTAELLANSVMLAAELGGMAIALSLLTGISWHLLFPVAALGVVVMAWRAPFKVIENGPAILGLVTLCFVAAIFALGGPGKDLLPTLWKPPVTAQKSVDYFFLVAAILGAIISPYLIYFYSSGAREEKWSRGSLHVNKVTAIVGMTFGGVVAVALIVVAAVVLGPQHIEAGTLGEIGLALVKPWGSVGAVLFALSLLIACYGAALEIVLAVPYELAQGFGWEFGKDKRPAQAPRFNLAIVLFMVVAVAIGLIGVDPLQLTLYGSAFTALVLPISLSPVLLIMNDRDYMGNQTNSRWMNVATVAILVIAGLVSLVTLPLTLASGGGQ